MMAEAHQRIQVTISKAASLLGVSTSTLRYWDKHGKLIPRRHPVNGYRMYNLADIERLKQEIEGTYVVNQKQEG
jgi:DNA-binding transcriptional MerR regulator